MKKKCRTALSDYLKVFYIGSVKNNIVDYKFYKDKKKLFMVS